MMNHLNKSLFLFLLFFLCSLITSSQIWPYAPIIRFANTVYYKLEDKTPLELHGTNLAFDQNLNNRFFDVICKSDSIQIFINGSKSFFKQRCKVEPKGYKEIPFYSRRILRNDSATIKYLKLVEINDSSIIAKGTLRYKHQLFKKREMIEIKRRELVGLFIGTGENYRNVLTVISFGCVFIVLVM